MNLSREKEQALKEALTYLQEAIAADKCRACGCFHQLVVALEQAFLAGAGPQELQETVEAAKRCLVERQYECLGCEVCIPPLVVNTLTQVWVRRWPTLRCAPQKRWKNAGGGRLCPEPIRCCAIRRRWPYAASRLRTWRRRWCGRPGRKSPLSGLCTPKTWDRAPYSECSGQPPPAFCDCLRPRLQASRGALSGAIIGGAGTAWD